MSFLPEANTPLNQHSLEALELWLNQLGAQKSNEDPCLWILEMPSCSVQISLDQDDLIVTWESKGKKSQCSFPYGLSRLDVQNALVADL